MRAVGVIGGIAATAMTVLGSLGAAPSAHASNFGIELNGTWRVMSNGEWARTNQVLIGREDANSDLDHQLELRESPRMLPGR